MKVINDENGSVLVEGVVALVILTVLSLLIFSCLRLSGDLMDRSRVMREHLYQAKFQAEWEEIPEDVHEREVTFSIGGEVVAAMKVVEYIYEEEESYIVVVHPYNEEKDSMVP